MFVFSGNFLFETGLLILLKKDSSVRFMHHNTSKLDHKQPDPDHLKAQDKRPQAIFVSGRISETFS